MNAERFARELPRLFTRFPRSPHPRDRRFAPILEDVGGLARENNLALLNLAASCLDAGESYVEVGSFKGLSLIAAMLGNTGDFVGIDDFSLDGGSRRRLEIHGRWAWMRSHLSLTITPPSGAPVRRAGHTLTILRKNPAGAWVIARDANLL